MQVFRRDTLRHVFAKVGSSGAPLKEVRQRIKTWLLPIYGYTEEEELGTVPTSELQGMLLNGTGDTYAA